ncbi:MAG: protein translocase subunit SecF, partial [Anaerolineales bacterium]
MDIIGKRYWFFALSTLAIIPGLVALVVWGLPLAIDFTGGAKLDVQLPDATALSTNATVTVLEEFGFADNIVQLSDNNVLIIRTKDMSEATRSAIMDRLGEVFASEVILQ